MSSVTWCTDISCVAEDDHGDPVAFHKGCKVEAVVLRIAAYVS